YRMLIVNGWDLYEFWFVTMISPYKKNTLALESGTESATGGFRGFIKRIFLLRISGVFASGTAQVRLLNSLRFSGKVHITNGVGLINKPPRKIVSHSKSYAKRFLYLGRLAPEKNLTALVEAFNSLPGHTLTIVGKGPLGDHLIQIAASNILFKSHLQNSGI